MSSIRDNLKISEVIIYRVKDSWLLKLKINLFYPIFPTWIITKLLQYFQLDKKLILLLKHYQLDKDFSLYILLFSIFFIFFIGYMIVNLFFRYSETCITNSRIITKDISSLGFVEFKDIQSVEMKKSLVLKLNYLRINYKKDNKNEYMEFSEIQDSQRIKDLIDSKVKSLVRKTD